MAYGRRGLIMDPADRPIRRRKAARVVVRAQGKVLVEIDSDPGVADFTWLITPGGGIDAGENARETAVRELFEETGLKITADDLAGPIARRTVSHGYSDQVLIQEEVFYLLDLAETFTPDDTFFTDAERTTMQGFLWLEPKELAGYRVWPAELGRLAGFSGEDFIDLGEVEESSVPI